jgi:hypothetical protein
MSNSIEGQSMRKNLGVPLENSDFLKQYVPSTQFTDIRWEVCEDTDGKMLWSGLWCKTGVRRGLKGWGDSAQLAVLDDLISDGDARSVISAVEDTVYKTYSGLYAAPHQELDHLGSTPFNAKTPCTRQWSPGAWGVTCSIV